MTKHVQFILQRLSFGTIREMLKELAKRGTVAEWPLR